MKLRATTLPGVLVLEPVVHADERGCFLETFHRARYAGAGVELDFVQDNVSLSIRGTLRGLHYQLTKPQGKLVSVTRGEIFDVAVDIRRDSPMFGRWFGTVLSAANRRQLWIPPGYAHGFLATSPEADVTYKCTRYYDAADERAIRWNDPDLGIAWPYEDTPRLSPRDEAAPWLRDAELPR